MTSLLITGYKAFEIGISTEKDMRINIIKEAAKRDLIRFLAVSYTHLTLPTSDLV